MSTPLQRHGTFPEHKRFTALDEALHEDRTVVGKVTGRECQQLSSLLSTMYSGGQDAVPPVCTHAAFGTDTPQRHSTAHSWAMGWFAKAATHAPGGVNWAEVDPRVVDYDQSVGGGDVTRGECVILAKHLARTFGNLSLLPTACEHVADDAK